MAFTLTEDSDFLWQKNFFKQYFEFGLFLSNSCMIIVLNKKNKTFYHSKHIKGLKLQPV